MVKKALRYVRGTTGLMLTYRKSETLKIEGYSDSDFAGDADDRKSTSGYIFTLAKGAISWKSSKQTVTASSTMYAEFVACYEASGQVTWIKKFVPGLKVVDSIEKPLKLYCETSQQYSMLITTSRVVLPNTSTSSFMLLRSKSRIKLFF